MKKHFYCAASFAMFLGYNLPVPAQQSRRSPRSVAANRLWYRPRAEILRQTLGISATSRARTSALSFDPLNDGLTDSRSAEELVRLKVDFSHKLNGRHRRCQERHHHNPHRI